MCVVVRACVHALHLLRHDTLHVLLRRLRPGHAWLAGVPPATLAFGAPEASIGACTVLGIAHPCGDVDLVVVGAIQSVHVRSAGGSLGVGWVS